MTDSTETALHEVQTRYKVERRFRRKEGMAGVRKNTEESRVHSALLEYGESLRATRGLEGSGEATAGATEEKSGDGGGGGGGGDGGGAGGLAGDAVAGLSMLKSASAQNDQNMSAFERKLAKEQKRALEEEIRLEKERGVEENAIMEHMQELSAGGGAEAAKGLVGSIVGTDAAAIAAASAAYQESVDETKRMLEESGKGGRHGQIAAYKRQKAALERQAEALQPRVDEVGGAFSLAQERLETLSKEKEEQNTFVERLKTEIEKLTVLEQQSEHQVCYRKFRVVVLPSALPLPLPLHLH